MGTRTREKLKERENFLRDIEFFSSHSNYKTILSLNSLSLYCTLKIEMLMF